MRRTTVALAADLGAILRLGLEAAVAEAGCEVVRGRGADAVLLALDAPGCAARAAALLRDRPRPRVIGCSADRPVLVVFTGTRARELPLDVAGLRAALLG